MKITYLIVPAVTDQAGQCRIVSRESEASLGNALADYRSNSDAWADVGIMNSRGKLVCLDCKQPEHYQEMRNDQPLTAGLAYTFDA